MKYYNLKQLFSMVAEKAQRAAIQENMQIEKTPANQENIFISSTTQVSQILTTHAN